IEWQVTRILSHTHNFKFTACFRLPAAVVPHRVFVFLKLSRERFIDDCYFLRRGRILLRQASSFDDRCPDDLEVACGNSIPGSRVVIVGTWSGMAIYPDAGTPRPGA